MEKEKTKTGESAAGLILLKPILFLFCQRTLRLSKTLSLDLAPALRHGNEPPHTHTMQEDRNGKRPTDEGGGKQMQRGNMRKETIAWRCEMGKAARHGGVSGCQECRNIGEREGEKR